MGNPKSENVGAHRDAPSFSAGDSVTTPDGVEAIVLGHRGDKIMVKFPPGESLGLYDPAQLTLKKGDK